MSEPKERKRDAWLIGLAGFVTATVVFWVWAFVTHVEKLGDAGVLGDSFGPVAGIANAIALIVALRALALQREELRLQRKEMRDARAEMVEQRKQLERTAEAQEALAKATNLLANAQLAANGRAARLELAYREGTLAMLTNAIGVAEAAFTVAHPSSAGDRRNHYVDHVQQIIDAQRQDYADLHAEVFGDSNGEGTSDAQESDRGNKEDA